MYSIFFTIYESNGDGLIFDLLKEESFTGFSSIEHAKNSKLELLQNIVSSLNLSFAQWLYVEFLILDESDCCIEQENFEVEISDGEIKQLK